MRDAEGNALDLVRQADNRRNWVRSHPNVRERIRRIEHEIDEDYPDIALMNVSRIGPSTSDVSIRRGLGIKL